VSHIAYCASPELLEAWTDLFKDLGLEVIQNLKLGPQFLITNQVITKPLGFQGKIIYISPGFDSFCDFWISPADLSTDAGKKLLGKFISQKITFSFNQETKELCHRQMIQLVTMGDFAEELSFSIDSQLGLRETVVSHALQVFYCLTVLKLKLPLEVQLGEGREHYYLRFALSYSGDLKKQHIDLLGSRINFLVDSCHHFQVGFFKKDKKIVFLSEFTKKDSSSHAYSVFEVLSDNEKDAFKRDEKSNLLKEVHSGVIPQSAGEKFIERFQGTLKIDEELIRVGGKVDEDKFIARVSSALTSASHDEKVVIPDATPKITDSIRWELKRFADENKVPVEDLKLVELSRFSEEQVPAVLSLYLNLNKNHQDKVDELMKQKDDLLKRMKEMMVQALEAKDREMDQLREQLKNHKVVEETAKPEETSDQVLRVKFQQLDDKYKKLNTNLLETKNLLGEAKKEALKHQQEKTALQNELKELEKQLKKFTKNAA